METGTLSEWYLEEGSGFSAGESIAKIETDKASIDFEAQDDGYIGTYIGVWVLQRFLLVCAFNNQHK